MAYPAGRLRRRAAVQLGRERRTSGRAAGTRGGRAAGLPRRPAHRLNERGRGHGDRRGRNETAHQLHPRASRVRHDHRFAGHRGGAAEGWDRWPDSGAGHLRDRHGREVGRDARRPARHGGRCNRRGHGRADRWRGFPYRVDRAREGLHGGPGFAGLHHHGRRRRNRHRRSDRCHARASDRDRHRHERSDRHGHRERDRHGHGDAQRHGRRAAR